MKRLLALASLVLGAAACVPPATGPWGITGTGHASTKRQQVRTVTETFLDGRSFLLRLGGVSGRQVPRPLVVMLHGLNQSAAEIEQDTGLDAFADAHNFVVAYPQALPGATGLASWNAGGCCDNQSADDLQFLQDVVHYTEQLTPIDPARVYVWGFSNGGMMALDAICNTSGVFAAAASQSGPYLGQTCNRPIWRHLQGDPDDIVPAHGGVGTFPSYDWAHYCFPDSTQEPARFGGFVSFQLVPGATHKWLTPSNNSSGIDTTSDFWEHTSGFSL